MGFRKNQIIDRYIYLEESKFWSDRQRERLNEVYKTDQYPTDETKEELAKSLGCTKKQITNYFRRKRASDRKKERRDRAKVKIVSPVVGQVAKRAPKRKFTAPSPEYNYQSKSPDFRPTYSEPEDTDEPDTKRFKYNPFTGEMEHPDERCSSCCCRTCCYYSGCY